MFVTCELLELLSVFFRYEYLLNDVHDYLFYQVPTYKLITPSVVSERLKIRGSLARKALQELHSKGL